MLMYVEAVALGHRVDSHSPAINRAFDLLLIPLSVVLLRAPECMYAVCRFMSSCIVIWKDGSVQRTDQYSQFDIASFHGLVPILLRDVQAADGEDRGGDRCF